MSEPRQPEDHKPKKAKKPPVDETRKITLGDHEYTVDPTALDDLEAMEAMEDGRWIAVLRMLLGDVQWARFKVDHADERGRVTSAKFAGIIEELDGQLRTLGNSQASSN